MQAIPKPKVKREFLYVKIQHGIRKDIKRAFEFVQSKCHVFPHASSFMTVDKMTAVVQ